MANSTVSSLNSLYAEIFEDAIFVAREMNLMAGLVTNYQAMGMADRNMGIYPTQTAQQVAEGVDFAVAQEFTKTSKMTITPKTMMAQYILTDDRMETDPDDAMQDCVRELGASIGTAIDTDLVGLFGSLTTDKGTAGNAATITLFANAIAVLRNNKAPNPIRVVCHPYGWHDIWVLLGQPATEQAFLGDTANEAMRDYFVGNFIGAEWYIDANIAVDASDDAISGIFHAEGLALDTRKVPTMEVERDASLRASEINMHVKYGVGVRRQEFAVALTHDATEPA